MKSSQFNSFADFAKAVCATWKKCKYAHWDNNWHGANLYEGHKQLFEAISERHCIPAVEKFYTPNDMVIKSADSNTSTWQQSCSGFFFDIGLVNEGIPEAWMDMQELPNPKPHLTIRIKSGASASVDNAEGCKKLANIADLYLAACAKYQVRVVVDYAINAYHYDGGSGSADSYTSVVLCDYSQQLDTLSLVSAVSLVWFRLALRFLEAQVFPKEVNKGANVGARWTKDWKKYCQTDIGIERAVNSNGEDEIIIPPIYGSNMHKFNLDNLLREGKIYEGAE
jgi:hypothetical protein